MDLYKSVVAQPSRAQVEKIVNFIGSDQERFDQLVKIFLDGPYRITQRAAMPLSRCVERHPVLARGKIARLVKAASAEDAIDAVKRNVVRMLQFIDIPPRDHGSVAQLCTKFLADNGEAIAIRVFSMTVLANLSKIYPELRSDLKVIIEEQLPYASPAFISRARKILKDAKGII